MQNLLDAVEEAIGMLYKMAQGCSNVREEKGIDDEVKKLAQIVSKDVNDIIRVLSKAYLENANKKHEGANHE